MTAPLRRVSWDDPDAILLRAAQSDEIAAMYGGEESFEHRARSEEIAASSIVAAFLSYDGLVPVGHIALRRLGDDVEIKRMYVAPSHRGTGIADELLAAVEEAAQKAGADRIVLHTGNRQQAALTFYARHGYTSIPVYPPYEAVRYSLCFEKVLP